MTTPNQSQDEEKDNIGEIVSIHGISVKELSKQDIEAYFSLSNTQRLMLSNFLIAEHKQNISAIREEVEKIVPYAELDKKRWSDLINEVLEILDKFDTPQKNSKLPHDFSDGESRKGRREE